MPHADPDPEDPTILVGVGLPGDEATTREMAAAFADEFARMGYDREQILALFCSPFYAGANDALRLLGDGAIVALVEESVGFWGRLRVEVLDAPSGAAQVNAVLRGLSR